MTLREELRLARERGDENEVARIARLIAKASPAVLLPDWIAGEMAPSAAIVKGRLRGTDGMWVVEAPHGISSRTFRKLREPERHRIQEALAETREAIQSLREGRSRCPALRGKKPTPATATASCVEQEARDSTDDHDRCAYNND
jgi:hypothetical protein